MTRRCPHCGAELDSLQVRCKACGKDLPEARDLRSDPDAPRCAVCSTPMPLQDVKCPRCGADGYPALRARRGKKSLGSE